MLLTGSACCASHKFVVIEVIEIRAMPEGRRRWAGGRTFLSDIKGVSLNQTRVKLWTKPVVQRHWRDTHATLFVYPLWVERSHPGQHALAGATCAFWRVRKPALLTSSNMKTSSWTTPSSLKWRLPGMQRGRISPMQCICQRVVRRQCTHLTVIFANKHVSWK